MFVRVGNVFIKPEAIIRVEVNEIDDQREGKFISNVVVTFRNDQKQEETLKLQRHEAEQSEFFRPFLSGSSVVRVK